MITLWPGFASKRRMMEKCLEKIITVNHRAVALRLWNEDCVSGMASRLQPGSVDVIVTSPPYNLGIRYKTYDDSASRKDYLDWTRRWMAQAARILSEKGSFFLNVGSAPTDPWIPFEILSVARDFFVLQNVIHWVKSIAIEAQDMGDYEGRPAGFVAGHYKPIPGDRFLNDCHEYIFHLTPQGRTPLDREAVGVPYQDKSNVKRWKSAARDLHCRGNVWFMPYKTIRSRNLQRPHPATFPVRLPLMCLKLHGVQRVRMAADPFLGLGSTALACAELGVPFTGFEIDEFYIAEAFRRICGAADKAPLFNL